MFPRLFASAVLALAVLLPASSALAQDAVEDPSAAAATEVPAATAPPTAAAAPSPAPVEATPSPERVAASAGDLSVTVTWAPPTGERSPSGYVVRLRTGTTVVATRTVAATARTASFADLRSGVAHVAAVTAVYPDGRESPPAESAPVSPRNPAPEAPTKVSAKAGLASATVSWTDPRDADLAAVQVRIAEGTISAFSRTTGAPVCRVEAGTARCAITGLEAGRSYTVTLHPVDSAGQWGPGTSLVLRGTSTTAGPQRSRVVGRQPLAVRGRISPAPAAGSRVIVQARTQRLDRTWGSWAEVGRTTTAADGGYTLTDRPNRNVQYRARFAGAGAHVGSTSTASTVNVVPAPFATASGVPLHPVSPNTTVTGYHQANAGTRALTLQPGDLFHNNASGKLSIPRSPLHTTLIMPSRGRGTAATSAVDLAVPKGETVLSPVTGRVRAVSSYTLYGSTRDQVIMITPEGRRDLDVAVLHVSGPKVRVGQQVVAGATPVATARFLPFGSQIDRWAGRVPHVHIDVRRR